MAEPKELEAIPKDVDNRVSKSVYNPLKVDFTHKFDGEEITIKAGEKYNCPKNVAVLLAKHLATVIVKRVAVEDREALLAKIEDKEERRQAEAKPYPLFSYRVGDVAKILVADYDAETPKASKILDEASEDSAREKGREGKDDNKQDTTGDLIGEDDEEVIDTEGKIEEEAKEPEDAQSDDAEEEVDIDDLTDEELQIFAKQNDVAIGNIKSREKIIAKIGKELS